MKIRSMNSGVVIWLSMKTARMGTRQYKSREIFLFRSALGTRHNPADSNAAQQRLTPPATNIHAVLEDNRTSLAGSQLRYSKLKPARSAKVRKTVPPVGR